MARKETNVFVSVSKHFIDALSTKEKYRLSKTDFIRNRKLPFEQLVLCMLKLLRKSLQAEIYSFFREVGTSVKSVTASAFVQSRKKIKPDLFYDLNHIITNEFYTDNDENVKLYKGMRVLSVDGSTINLPFNKELIAEYGFFNNQKKTNDVVIGRVSVLYDVLNEIVIDGLLRPFSQGEVTLSREHFKYAEKGDLIIMDRAYPNFESAYILGNQEVDFLFRCKKSFSNQVRAFYESGKQDETIQIKAKQNKSFKDLPYSQHSTITVRMLRVKLDSGEVEILMTSLLDSREFPLEEFKELYFKRWKVETYYNRFKNIIGVEHFSGTSHQFIQQEFNCALYMSNMQTILTQDAENEAIEKYKNRRYEYKINQSLSLGLIREKLIQMFTNKEDEEKLLEELKQLFVANVVPIRPGRSNKRDVDKHRQRTKPKQFKNRRII